MSEQGPRIAVVEDDAGVRKLLETVLAKEGCRVVLCESAEAALRTVSGSFCDLLIIDLLMPGMGGLGLIRRLRNAFVLTPVLLLAGVEDHPSLPAALGYSGVSLLAKPFTLAECRRAVARLLPRRSPRR